MSVKVYYINVKNISENGMRSYYSNLSKERKEKVDRLKFFEDKRLSTMAEVLLKYALEKEGITFPKKILVSESGKPYIDEIYFNISHSKEYVAVAVSKEEVGCDIEKIAEVNLDIAKRFFNTAEYNKIISLKNGRKRKKLFYRYWTIKESFVKAVGCGLNKPLDSFSIDLDKKIAVSQDGIEGDFCFAEFKRIKGYALSVCSKVKEVEFYRATAKKIRIILK